MKSLFQKQLGPTVVCRFPKEAKVFDGNFGLAESKPKGELSFKES